MNEITDKTTEQEKKMGKRKLDMARFFEAKYLASLISGIAYFSKSDNNLIYMAMLLILWKISQEHKDQLSFDEFRAHLYEDLESLNKNLRPLDEKNPQQPYRPYRGNA